MIVQCRAAGSRPMQTLAQPHGACSRTPASRREFIASTGHLAPRQLHGSQCIDHQQQQTAAISILSAESRSVATYTDSWMPPARRTARVIESVRPRQQEQLARQQQSSSNTSSSKVEAPSPPAAQIQAAYQPPTHATSANDDSHRSTRGQTSSQSTQETLASAVDKMYRQRLREVKAMLTPESLQQLKQELSLEGVQSLQVVLQDLNGLEGSWEEEDEQLNVTEQQLVQQVTSAAQIMPDDFNSYLLGMLPPGSDTDDVQQLLLMLDDYLIHDLKSVYHELKEFEQADLELSVAQDRYIELSGRISAVAARIQEAMVAQQQQQQRQQQRHQQRRSWQATHSSNKMGVDAQQQQQQQQQQHLLRNEPTAAAAPAAQQSSSSSSSSRKWGSTWVKPQRVADRHTATQQQQQQQQQQRQQQHELQGGILPVIDAPSQHQQQQQLKHLSAAGQQQQQQPGVRQRRRRIIRRDPTD